MIVPIKVINPTARRRKKNKIGIRRVKVRGGYKIKHRPVFYSDMPGKLGARSPKATLNKRRKKRKHHKSKLHTIKEVNNVAYKRKKKRTKVHNRKKTYKRRKKTNPGFSYRKRRYHKRRVHNRRRSYRRRRNPNGEVAALTTTNIMQMGAGAVAGAVGPVWVTNSFGIMGNMKYIAQVGIGLIGWWGLRKIGLRRMALPFVSAAVGVTALEFARDTNLLAGLGNVYYTYDDIRNLNRLQPVNGLGTVLDNRAMLTNGNPGMGTVLDNQMMPTMGHDEMTMESEN